MKKELGEFQIVWLTKQTHDMTWKEGLLCNFSLVIGGKKNNVCAEICMLQLIKVVPDMQEETEFANLFWLRNSRNIPCGMLVFYINA